MRPVLVFNNIEEMSGWQGCSVCAAGNPTDNFWDAPFQTSPSLDGASLELFDGGQAWSNALWYKSLGAHDSVSHFLFDFYIYYDADAAAHLHVTESDVYQAINGLEWMMGSQCNFDDGWWQTWDQLGGAWVTSSIPCARFTPYTWHHIQWYLERVGTDQYRYDTLVVDGTTYNMNLLYTASKTGWSDVLGIQYELDLNPPPFPRTSGWMSPN